MSEPNFSGWTGFDDKAADGNLQFLPFKPKTWDEDDLEVKLLYCGLCASDPTALSGGLGPVPERMIAGHEMVGEVTRVGSQVKDRKVGDIVGVGAMVDSCMECEFCKAEEEQFCAVQTNSIGFQTEFHRGNAKGEQPWGGFAKYWRGPAHFAIPVPKEIDPAVAGPLMCGGITVFSPLKHWGAGTTRKRVGIVGVGGLGHMAIMIAKAMGAEVTAISRGESKKEDALKLGASKYIATGKNTKEAFKGHERSLDLILCTINPKELTPDDYAPLLRPRGAFVMVGIIPNPMTVSSNLMIMGGSTAIAGSYLGSPNEIRELFDLAAKNKLAPWIRKYNMDDINEALVEFNKNGARYRFVLVNTDNGGKM